MRITLTLSILFFAGILSARTGTRINPIIGDQSYILKYGVAPNEKTDDQVRIATHLEYAEYLLRSKDVSAMSAEQIGKRTHLLDLLHEYWTRGIFPRNDDHTDGRRPCFIDHEGTICAVGYLVEQTAGHDVAELISERFLYGEIMEMNDPVVMNWIEECGLTREECAIIQPTYGESRRRMYFRDCLSYGVSYRVNNDFSHSIRFMHDLRYKSKRSHGIMRNALREGIALGAEFDWLNNGAYSAGLIYSARLRSGNRFRDLEKSIALQPEFFYYNSQYGINLRPGFQFTRSWNRITASAEYSYAIPIANEEAYQAGRHEFSLRLGINFDLPKPPKLPKIPRWKDRSHRIWGHPDTTPEG